MNPSLTATASITINAPAEQVWNALTKPEMIKQYMFGADVITDWQIGSPIIWKGEWQGAVFEDKGVIVRLIPNKVLEYTYNHASSTQENLVTNELAEENGLTRLTITQTGSANEAAREHSEKNWAMVLESIKKMLENK